MIIIIIGLAIFPQKYYQILLASHKSKLRLGKCYKTIVLSIKYHKM